MKKLTITIAGETATGKTRVAEYLRRIFHQTFDVPIVTVTDTSITLSDVDLLMPEVMAKIKEIAIEVVQTQRKPADGSRFLKRGRDENRLPKGR